MSNWNYTTSTEETEHGDVFPQEDKVEETRWCGFCNAWESAEVDTCAKAEEARRAAEEAGQLAEAARITRTLEAKAMKTKRQKLICSCGSYYCGAITAFGLSVPTFTAEIRPISSQYARDVRARDIKAGGGL